MFIALNLPFMVFPYIDFVEVYSHSLLQMTVQK